MKYILHIDSSTKVCSIALSNGDQLLELIETDSETLAHSEKLHVFIEECLKKAGIKPANLSAICVSKGPGSYTGLRIGVSAAKGLCYGLSIPFIAIDTLEAMADSVQSEVDEGAILIPMIDARRVEVFCSIHQNNNTLAKVHARVLDEKPFTELEGKKGYYFGDGAEKAIQYMPLSFTFLKNQNTSAKNLISLAWKKFENNDFEDTAYFEPFYLKDFKAGKPKKVLK